MPEPTYTQAITELEDLVRRMQEPACDIDLLSQYTRRSKELLEICRQRLTATDNEIKALLANIEQEQPNP